MNQYPDRMSTPGASRKRKDLDTLYKSSFISTAPGPSPNCKSGGEAWSSNRLLAGYMAHEFLTKGTLLGNKFDSARGQSAAAALRGSVAEAKKPKNGEDSYAEVASLLKTDGSHIPEIVNPTQLARWIKM